MDAVLRSDKETGSAFRLGLTEDLCEKNLLQHDRHAVGRILQIKRSEAMLPSY